MGCGGSRDMRAAAGVSNNSRNYAQNRYRRSRDGRLLRVVVRLVRAMIQTQVQADLLLRPAVVGHLGVDDGQCG